MREFLINLPSKSVRMKIRKLKIKNYKVFDDVEFDFTDRDGNALDIVVLAGVNGCGKTTVLEVIKDCLSKRFITPVLTSGAKVEFEFDLTTDEIETTKSRIPPISSSSNDMRAPDMLKKLQQKVISFSLGHPYASLEDLVGLTQVHPSVFTIVYFPVMDGEETPFSEGVKVLRLGQKRGDMKRIILKRIRDEVFKNKNFPPQQVIDGEIKTITRTLKDLELKTQLVDLESEALVFESTNGKRIYFEQLSHGEQHLYFRAIYLSQLNIKDGIIMIDEPEAAFHPTWQQKIAQLYRNVGENNQVFMATHSPHIMASVPPESLFILHIDEKTRKVQIVNAAKAGKHSQGLEPNRILKEVMQVDTLRDYETQRDIERLAELLTPDDFESKEAEKLAEKLTAQLGREDPFIIRLEHQLLMLRRKKNDLAVA